MTQENGSGKVFVVQGIIGGDPDEWVFVGVCATAEAAERMKLERAYCAHARQNFDMFVVEEHEIQI